MTISSKARRISQARALVPTEEQEQLVLAQWLDTLGVVWFHPANEGKRKPQYAAKMAKLGLKAGVPDVLIFSPPRGGWRETFLGGSTGHPVKGVAIELKRKRFSKQSVEQAAWLAALDSAGWAVQLCHGADDAIEFLRLLGYGVVD